MKASIDSENNFLQELVSRKRSSSDDETKTPERWKSAHTASQKANTMSSDEDDASEKANTQRQHDASEADVLSLFGDDIDEREDIVLEDMKDGESDNASLLSEISSFLSCSEDTGPPIASGLADLINEKFNAEYSVEKRKEILQKYKKPIIVTMCLFPK